MPLPQRLSRKEFLLLSKDPSLRVVFNALGTLKAVSGETKTLSVVTSSKHEKRAVIRNKLRRRLYSLFRQSPSCLSGILYVSKKSYPFPFVELKKYFYELLEKAEKSAK